MLEAFSKLCNLAASRKHGPLMSTGVVPLLVSAPSRVLLPDNQDAELAY